MCRVFEVFNVYSTVIYIIVSIFIVLSESSGFFTFASTSNSFIFSLRNKEGLRPFKSLVTDPFSAIVRYSDYGPTFGGGYDIRTANNANSNQNSHTNFGFSYFIPSGVQDQLTILAGTRGFSPDDWEVFHLAY